MNNKGFTLIELCIVIVVIAIIPIAAYGYIYNIILLSHTNITPITLEITLRVIGIFLAPLGVVMGYI